ncbi:MAG TPA: FxsA family protein [Spirochaetia bacterium]|nr:FxsA family protein [Spirochaetia bacterium]
MLDIKLLIRLFDRGFLLRSLNLLLLFSLVPIAEIALAYYLSTVIGVFLTLALLSAAGLVGMVISYREMKRTLVPLKEKVKEGYYPEREFANLLGAVICSLFLVTPGFISDVAGLVLFFPVLRRKVGGAIAVRMDGKMKEIYEYLKMYDL